jgi:hypothetical protein
MRGVGTGARQNRGRHRQNPRCKGELQIKGRLVIFGWPSNPFDGISPRFVSIPLLAAAAAGGCTIISSLSVGSSFCNLGLASKPPGCYLLLGIMDDWID